jgi:D-alanyl-D-alanine carboxypeptidase
VTERTRTGDRARITREALNYTGSGMGVLRSGRRVPVQTLLHGLLLPSGNDAAIALALRVSGSQRAFVGRMNERAALMGLACTRFASPSGIVDRGNHSCAADLAQLSRAVLDDQRLARIVRRRRAILPFHVKGGHIFLYNNNPLVRRGYPGVLGVKTGYTRAAGRCLVAAARRAGRRLGVVLLRSPDPGRQAQGLLDAGFRLRT